MRHLLFDPGRVDSGRQPAGAVPTPDAQVHLDADAARGLTVTPSGVRCARDDSSLSAPGFDIRQKRRQQSDQREERAELEDVFDARAIGQFAEDSGTDPGHAKGQSEK